MGYIVHNAIVVTSFSEAHIGTAHKEARLIFGHLVSEIVDSRTNGYQSFFIAPDGSKEGWEDSNSGDSRREQFLSWGKRKRNNGVCIDCVEIRYGGDMEEPPKIADYVMLLDEGV